MNPEIKTLWLDALRSGEYKQGKHALHRLADNSFCCLGVLCDVVVKSDMVDIVVEEHSGVSVYNGDALTLPLAIAEVAQINPFGGLLDGGAVWSSGGHLPYRELTEINDYTDLTFNEIADIIEEKF